MATRRALFCTTYKIEGNAKFRLSGNPRIIDTKWKLPLFVTIATQHVKNFNNSDNNTTVPTLYAAAVLRKEYFVTRTTDVFCKTKSVRTTGAA